MTEASRQALSILRSLDHFDWYLIPFLVLILYVYIVEVQRRDWDAVLVGLIFFAAEFCWEMFNALVLHFSQRSALWTAPGDTAFLIFVGLNIEIAGMFALAGVVLVKSLPDDRRQKVLGLPNRLIIPAAWGLFCVFIEVLLNRWGALVWEYSFWSWPHIYLIVLVYVSPFILMAWVYDHVSTTAKAKWLGFWILIDVLAWMIFVVWLKWI